jgi:hypothetical protein
MQTKKEVAEFINEIKTSFLTNFIQLTLGAYKGEITTLKNIYIKQITVKKEAVLSFTYRHTTNDIVKNYSLEKALENIDTYLKNGFCFAALFTDVADVTITLKNEKWFLQKLPPTKASTGNTQHNKQKKHLIAPSVTYLQNLGVTNTAGIVLKNKQDKFVQINHYINILATHLDKLPQNKTCSIVDMGSGKGYLTFALHDYLTNTLKINQLQIVGVEFRKDLVATCNNIAQKNKMLGLSFTQNTIENYPNTNTNVLIALHACDTATDDAIAYGVSNNANLIVVAPCCHKQIRKEMTANNQTNPLTDLVKHGVFLERQAEMVTDTIRALILEYFGYKVKVFEFVTDEHTPKNIMIIAEKMDSKQPFKTNIINKINEIKAFFGINTHFLERKLLTV